MSSSTPLSIKLSRAWGNTAGRGSLAVQHAVEIDPDHQAIVSGHNVSLRALHSDARAGDIDAGGR